MEMITAYCCERCAKKAKENNKLFIIGEMIKYNKYVPEAMPDCDICGADGTETTLFYCYDIG